MKKNHVMIIDDDNYTIDLYNLIIEMLPQKSLVTTENKALNAMKLLDHLYHHEIERFPDYIMLDIWMPGFHGFDFIKNFQERFPDRNGKTSFIITTSSIIDSDREKAFRFECVKDYVIKPIPSNYIEKLVNEGLP